MKIKGLVGDKNMFFKIIFAMANIEFKSDDEERLMKEDKFDGIKVHPSMEEAPSDEASQVLYAVKLMLEREPESGKKGFAFKMNRIENRKEYENRYSYSDEHGLIFESNVAQ